MRRGCKIAIGVLVVLVVLLILNTIVARQRDQGRRGQRWTAARSCRPPGGDLQVLDEGDPQRLADRADPLLHLLDELVGRAGAAAHRRATA